MTDTYLAIDSGGTNTRGLACDKNGKLLGHFNGPGANPKDIGWDAAYSIFRDCIHSLLKDDSSLKRICITAAGIGNIAAETPKIWSHPLKIDANKLIIIGDAYAAHLAAFLGADGIMVVAGTGSSLVGRKGRTSLRLGGWGHILGDQGSGYAIGLAGIRQAVIDSDLGSESELLRAIRKHYQIATIQDLLEHIHASPKAAVAGFAKEVLDLAYEGSEASTEIVKNQIQSFRLWFGRFLELDYPPKVSYTGGLFEHSYYLVAFSDLVKEEGLELFPPQLTPLEAAMQVALGKLIPLLP